MNTISKDTYSVVLSFLDSQSIDSMKDTNTRFQKYTEDFNNIVIEFFRLSLT